MTTTTLSRPPNGGAVPLHHHLDERDRARLAEAIALIGDVVNDHPFETSLVITAHVQAAVRDIERIRRDYEEQS